MFWLTSLYPDAAAGAVCGGFFFWSLNPRLGLVKRFGLLIGSVGMGYGLALPLAQSESGWAWVVAGLGASLVHVVIDALRIMVNTGSPFPLWLKDLIGLIPLWRGGDRRGGTDDNK